MSRALISFAAGLLLAVPAMGQNTVKTTPRGDWNVRVDLLIIAVAPGEAPALIRGFQDPHRGEATAETTSEMLGNGGAELIAWPVAWASDQGHALVETIEELLYATEYDPPQSLGGLVRPLQILKSFHVGVPTAFSTRNIGTTLEVETVVAADGTSVDLSLVPQSVRLAGFHRYRLDRSASGIKTFLEQPDFLTDKVTTSITVRSGERRLIGAFYGPKREDKVRLLILRATVLPAASAAKNPTR